MTVYSLVVFIYFKFIWYINFYVDYNVDNVIDILCILFVYWNDWLNDLHYCVYWYSIQYYSIVVYFGCQYYSVSLWLPLMSLPWSIRCAVQSSSFVLSQYYYIGIICCLFCYYHSDTYYDDGEHGVDAEYSTVVLFWNWPILCRLYAAALGCVCVCTAALWPILFLALLGVAWLLFLAIWLFYWFSTRGDTYDTDYYTCWLPVFWLFIYSLKLHYSTFHYLTIAITDAIIIRDGLLLWLADWYHCHCYLRHSTAGDSVTIVFWPILVLMTLVLCVSVSVQCNDDISFCWLLVFVVDDDAISL